MPDHLTEDTAGGEPPKGGEDHDQRPCVDDLLDPNDRAAIDKTAEQERLGAENPGALLWREAPYDRRRDLGHRPL